MRRPERMENAAEGIVVTVEPVCASLTSHAELARVAAFALVAEGRLTTTAIEINVVSDTTIHDLNHRFLAHDEPTDVLTFALDATDDFVHTAPPTLGEIYISCERAGAQCVEWGHTAEQELRFLVVHGVLHLLGWNDATSAERQRMLDRQSAILHDYDATVHG